MRPAQCAICGKYSIEETGGKQGDWVEFADFLPNTECLSHPDGLEYFCADHLNAAQALTHLTSGEAIERIRGATGLAPPLPGEAIVPSSFFQKLVRSIFK